jgi:Mn2+/Fe2+ NRAMP family transporter
VGIGTFSSNFVMFFIILTSAFTLNQHGITELVTSKQVAQALEPLAGRFATLLYTVGLVGTGLLAIPVLAGSGAYAFAELLGWRQGIDQRFRRARPFYLVLVSSVICGVGLDFADVNPVKALYWTAIINGLLAPFLLTGILIAASDKTLMQGQPSSPVTRIAVGLTTILMFGAAAAMFLV